MLSTPSSRGLPWSLLELREACYNAQLQGQRQEEDTVLFCLGWGLIGGIHL